MQLKVERVSDPREAFYISKMLGPWGFWIRPIYSFWRGSWVFAQNGEQCVWLEFVWPSYPLSRSRAITCKLIPMSLLAMVTVWWMMNLRCQSSRPLAFLEPTSNGKSHTFNKCAIISVYPTFIFFQIWLSFAKTFPVPFHIRRNFKACLEFLSLLILISHVHRQAFVETWKQSWRGCVTQRLEVEWSPVSGRRLNRN